MDFERNVLNKMKQNEIHATVSKEKMYKIADEIRDRLDAAGIVIEDTPTGARWKRRGV